MSLLIYGANGYTGELIARRARAIGVDPERVILAGRNAGSIAALGQSLGFGTRVFGLDDPARLDAVLDGVQVVLNCAGPFIRTALPLVEACLRRRAHYLDISGELAVLEGLAGRDQQARAAGITLLPAAGFDVVPSDCLAAEIHARLPAAVELTLAFEAPEGMSRGTAITSLEQSPRGGVVRRDGKLVRVPTGHRTRQIDFGSGERTAICIPWGDVATAYYTTGIPNIEVYAALPWPMRAAIRASNWLRPVLSSKGFQRLVVDQLMAGATGPSDTQRARGQSLLWAEGRDDEGRSVQLRLRTPESYELTSWTALELAERARHGKLPVGFQTPARACGKGLIQQFPGVSLTEVLV
ncbi:MAG TPA: saccharopine dehydrogenase NADP-binding domain-containing protein [Polyangiaceae bacterium]|nr:saccharopine dehydrogenase NADP-binding domain-containing protein [Polyangiaceae bacterium]